MMKEQMDPYTERAKVDFVIKKTAMQLSYK